MKQIRVRRGRGRALLVAAALMLAACGGGGAVAVDDVPGADKPAPTRTKPGGAGKPDATAKGTVDLEVWLVRDEALFPVVRSKPRTVAVGAAAIEELLAGPGTPETDLGLGTQIPAGTRLLDLDISDGIATVDLSGEFESGGGSASMFMRLAQVVYTLTSFPTVEGVRFRIDGRAVEVFSEEGIVLDDAVNRSDYEELLAPIVVMTPHIGARVSSPMTVAGTANVFEATVSMRLLDDDGNEIARKFTTATCGSGCRGDFKTRLRFDAGSSGQGTLEVFEESAEDGSAINVVTIPVSFES